MKISKKQLSKIIQEEIQTFLFENSLKQQTEEAAEKARALSEEEAMAAAQKAVEQLTPEQAAALSSALRQESLKEDLGAYVPSGGEAAGMLPTGREFIKQALGSGVFIAALGATGLPIGIAAAIGGALLGAGSATTAGIKYIKWLLDEKAKEGEWTHLPYVEKKYQDVRAKELQHLEDVFK